MSATGKPRTERRGERGATLLEMLVVLGILGLVTGLVFSSWTAPVRRVQLYEARMALVSNLRTARASALRGGEPVSLELAEDGRGYGWGARRVYLPGVVAIDGQPRAITFYTDGSSTGGALKLSDHGRSEGVSVDPVTGLVGPG
jgi:general secretion pathway protein H